MILRRMLCMTVVQFAECLSPLSTPLRRIKISKGKVYISNYPDNPPEWYWISGLHDSCIIGTESFEFPFDYNKFVGEKNIYNRNLITLRINAKGALYDNEVKEIRLFNYRILTEVFL